MSTLSKAHTRPLIYLVRSVKVILRYDNLYTKRVTSKGSDQVLDNKSLFDGMLPHPVLQRLPLQGRNYIFHALGFVPIRVIVEKIIYSASAYTQYSNNLSD